jgi:hypothetical protein
MSVDLKPKMASMLLSSKRLMSGDPFDQYLERSAIYILQQRIQAQLPTSRKEQDWFAIVKPQAPCHCRNIGIATSLKMRGSRGLAGCDTAQKIVSSAPTPVNGMSAVVQFIGSTTIFPRLAPP